MKPVQIDVAGTDQFYEALRTTNPFIQTVFRDGAGFVALANNIEQRLTPALSATSAFNAFFHGNDVNFHGVINVPEPADFGIIEEAPKEEVAAVPAAESTPPAAVAETPAPAAVLPSVEVPAEA